MTHTVMIVSRRKTGRLDTKLKSDVHGEVKDLTADEQTMKKIKTPQEMFEGLQKYVKDVWRKKWGACC